MQEKGNKRIFFYPFVNSDPFPAITASEEYSTAKEYIFFSFHRNEKKTEFFRSERHIRLGSFISISRRGGRGHLGYKESGIAFNYPDKSGIGKP